MSELEFPVLDAPATARQAAIAKIDLKALALSRFGEWKPEAEKVVAKYKGVIFDATTPKGYKSLTEAIAEVRAPRYAAQNVSKASKSELAAVSKAVGAEEAAVAAFLDSTEKELVAQKDAEDARREAEAERLRAIEAERVAGHRARIAAIRECVAKARGISAERIAKGMAAVGALVVDEATYQEFAGEAAVAKTETLEAMGVLFDSTKAAEDAAAAAEAQRIEQARVAEEQRIERERLADENARIDEARALIAKAEREAAEKIEADRKALAEERAAWLAEQEAAKPKLAPEPEPEAPTTITNPYTGEPRDVRDVESDPAGILIVEPEAPLVAAAAPAVKPEAATLSAGNIAARLGFALPVDYITSTLGIPPALVRGRATLWTASQFRAICQALVAQINSLAVAT